MINNHKIDTAGVNFIEGWESYVGYVYDDKVAPRKIKGKLVYQEYKGGPVKGTLTIGIGHTKAAKCQVDMSLGAKMSHEEAQRVLAVDLEPCEVIVNKLVKVKITQSMFNALVSFVYNCGEGNFRKSSILAKLNRGDYNGARSAFALYNKSKGEVMTGLTRRRTAEMAMWNEDGRVVALLDPTNHEETMGEAIPKTDEIATPSVVKSTEAMASAGQTTIGTGGIVNQISEASDHVDKVIEYKDKAEQLGVEPIALLGKVGPIFDYLIHSPMFWVFTAVAGFGIYTFFRRRWRLRQETV